MHKAYDAPTWRLLQSVLVGYGPRVADGDALPIPRASCREEGGRVHRAQCLGVPSHLQGKPPVQYLVMPTQRPDSAVLLAKWLCWLLLRVVGLIRAPSLPPPSSWATPYVFARGQPNPRSLVH